MKLFEDHFIGSSSEIEVRKDCKRFNDEIKRIKNREIRRCF